MDRSVNDSRGSIAGDRAGAPVSGGGRGSGFFDTLRRDLQYAVRALRRTPGFTAVAVLSLALGIGATTTMYSVVHAVVIDPFPYRDPETLVSIGLVTPRGRTFGYGYNPDEYAEIARRSQIFDGVIASTISDVSMTGRGDPERLRGNHASMNTFDVMGVAPLLGRTPGPADARPGAPPVAVLGYKFWQRRFGGSHDIIGQQLRLDGQWRTVIGVMPPRFMWRGADVYLPTVFRPGETVPGVQAVHVMGRLRPGVSESRADADLRPILNDLRAKDPARIPGEFRIELIPFAETFASDLGPALWVLLAAVSFLLLIACANVSSLLLARASAREREMAVRVALGAGRGRLVRQLLTESLLLAAAGAVAGVAAARFGLTAILAIVPPGRIPDEAEIALNPTVLLVTVIVTAASAVLFGLAPALQGTRVDPATQLRDGARTGTGARQTRLRGALVVAEVALAMILLVGAGLMIRALVKLQAIAFAFEPDRVLTMRIPLAETRYPEPEDRARFFLELIDRVRGLPGVTHVAVDSGMPGFGARGTRVLLPGDAVSEARPVQVHETSPDVFAISGIRLVSGRLIDDGDVRNARPVAVVNEAFVNREFAGEPAIGRHVRLPYLTDPRVGAANDTLEIVGVVEDAATVQSEIGRGVAPEIYIPFAVRGYPLALLVRTSLPPMQIERAVRAEVYAIDKEQPVTDVRTIEMALDEWAYSAPRFNLILLTIFSALGLLLAGVGLYGLVAYTVARQTREIGVRMALGADRTTILGMVLKRALLLVAIGVAIGATGALALTRVLASQLLGVSPRDPIAFVSVALLLGSIGVVAALWPALRAARVNPMAALRFE